MPRPLATIAELEHGVDHVRGPAGAPVVLEYGDYECPYSRRAFRAIERLERARPGGIRFAFRRVPLPLPRGKSVHGLAPRRGRA